MTVRNNPARYGSVAQAFHWLIVGLLIVQFTLAKIADDLPLGPDKVGTLARHKSVGITILDARDPAPDLAIFRSSATVAADAALADAGFPQCRMRRFTCFCSRCR